MRQLKAILFDSGRVLNSPKTGHWFIPPQFFHIVDRDTFMALPRENVEAAFWKAQLCERNTPLVLTEEDEYRLFIEYYQTFSHELEALNLSMDHIEKLAADTVYNDDKFVFYEDVYRVIPELFERYQLGVVSDTWPSLDRVFRHAGLRHYFGSFVMSSVLGVVKPHERMFLTALSELGIAAEEALFIDDNPAHLDGARKLGIQTCLMHRSGAEPIAIQDHPVIRNLQELKELLRGIDHENKPGL